MCFINDDYEWYPNVYESKLRVVTTTLLCNECNIKIEPGTEHHYIYIQEAEECIRCDRGDCECNVCCECKDIDVGQSFEYYRCIECDKLLMAVEQVELELGCHISESRPALTSMITEIAMVPHDHKKKYIKMAMHTFPGLQKSGYLGKIWKQIKAYKGNRIS